MYGTYGFAFHIEKDGFSIEVNQENGIYVYRRSLDGSSAERKLVSSGGRVIVNPVEPLNLPREVSRHLIVEFEPVSIEPGAQETVYLTFPIEVAVFVAAKGNYEVLDIFSWNRQKYTLYGSPDRGLIARWWGSQVAFSPPLVDPRREGLLSLTITNATNAWVDVSRVVLEGYGMKIFYDDSASIRAWMRISSSMVAETGCHDAPYRDGQRKSLELYTARSIPGIERSRFLMDQGI
ncbi:DUF432 domain-containing protein [Methanofollis fontis]|uniref:DUF432 domain-containing protein n=1 Tax=Methanofollis fontis TaxID=2052832 RepID=UPI0013EEE06C|nr:DUF432 domain-containing protein [Methanofollis fontis]